MVAAVYVLSVISFILMVYFFSQQHESQTDAAYESEFVEITVQESDEYTAIAYSLVSAHTTLSYITDSDSLGMQAQE